MTTALVVGEGGLRLALADVPALPRAGVLVDPLAVGVCGTDLEILRGARPSTAAVIGHEGVARVLATGGSVTWPRPGDLVVFNPVNEFDQDDVLGHSSDGLLRRRMTAAAGALVAAGPAIPIPAAALVEPLAIAMYAADLTQRAARQRRAVVYGGGGMGLMLAMLLDSRGVDTVIVHDREARLGWIADRGIASRDRVLVDSPSLAARVRERFGGEEADAVYLCTTRSSARLALERSVDVVRDGGAIDLVVGFEPAATFPGLVEVGLAATRRQNVCGVPEDGRHTMIRTPRGKSIALLGHRGSSRARVAEAATLMTSEPARYLRHVSHVVSLEALPRFLESCGRRQPGKRAEVTKVVVNMVAHRGSVVAVQSPEEVLGMEWEAPSSPTQGVLDGTRRLGR